MNRTKSTVLFLLLLLFVIGVTGCSGKQEVKVVKIGIQPWIGYGPWWIAQEKGFFKQYGLDVELVNFVEDKEINAAFASGDMQAANVGNYQAVRLYNSGLDLRIVLLEDVSYTADAIIAPTSIKSISDLKGLKVAYEEGTVHDVLINYALIQNGLALKDIQPVFVPAANTGTALIAGQVDAAITYEPYITETLKDHNNLHLLYTAAEKPGLISDVLVVNEKFLKENPETVKLLLKAWNAAMAYYKSNPEDAKAIIARGVGSDPKDLTTAFDGIVLYDINDNVKLFNTEFKTTLIEGASIAESIGVLDKMPDFNTLLDGSYLEK